MKCLIVLCAVVALTVAKPGYLHGGIAGLAAGYAGPLAAPGLIAARGIAVPAALAAPAVYAGPQHVPVIDASGVPVDTPDVQVARAAHSVAQGISAARAAAVPAGVIAGPGIAIGAPGVAVAAPAVYAGPQHLPVITASGVPVDTADVQVARAAHAVAQGISAARAAAAPAGVIAGPGIALGAPGIAVAAPAVYAGPQHLPVLTASGVPVDTPEVQAARAADVTAHLAAKARLG